MRALRRALEMRVGPVPSRVWRRLALPAAWAPFTAAELDDLIAWWRRDFNRAQRVNSAVGDGASSIVQNYAVDAFLAEVPERYKRATGLEPKVYACRSVDGAAVV